MGEALRRGARAERMAAPKGDGWRRTIPTTMTGARFGIASPDGRQWVPPCYRPGERIEYSTGPMVADRGGSLRRVTR